MAYESLLALSFVGLLVMAVAQLIMATMRTLTLIKIKNALCSKPIEKVQEKPLEIRIPTKFGKKKAPISLVEEKKEVTKEEILEEKKEE